MTTNEKLEIALEALKAIAEFTHAENCNSCAPIYECGCYKKDQWDLARIALDLIEGKEQ